MAASSGEVMCTTYKAFGAAGLIIQRRCARSVQVRLLGFAAFSNGAISSHGYGHIVDVLGPVHVGGITVYGGDLLHADANGVTTVPADIDQLADVCSEYVAAEDVVLDYVRAGDPTVAGLTSACRMCATHRRVRGSVALG